MQFFNNNQPDDDNSSDNQPTPPKQPDWRRWIWPGVLGFLLLWTLLSSQSFFSSAGQREIPYDGPGSVIEQAERGNIDELVIEGNSIRGSLRNPTSTTGSVFVSELPPNNAQDLLDILGEDVVVVARTPQESILPLLLLQFLPIALIIGFFIWSARRAQGQMGGIFGFGKSQAKEYGAEMTRVTFDDVAGQDSAKRELAEVVDFLKNPNKYIALGAKVPKGVLLVGPPGTGKTLLARAVAGEANVSYFSIAASEFVEMFVGVGASRVRDLFNKAKQNSPSIVFIDEIDAVGRRRGAGLGGGNDEREQTLNQMLAEMDGFDQDTNIIMIAATNRPDVLDPALLRPGRFDRQVTVDLPDREGRKQILRIHTRGKPLSHEVDLEALAKATVGFSGADLANLANEAALTAARENLSRIKMEHFTYAFERIVLGNERPPLSNQEERRIVAYHEAGHALVAALTPKADRVLKITITPRGQALGVTAFMPEDDRRNYPRGYLEARLKVLLGGRVAEQVVFNEITTGASDDLRRVTDMARRMVSQFGMSDALGPLNFGDDESQPFLGYSISQGRRYSEETASQIDEEVRRIVEHAYKETVELIANNRDALERIANDLLEHEMIEYVRLAEILNLEPVETVEGLEETVLPEELVEAIEEETSAIENEDESSDSLEDDTDDKEREKRTDALEVSDEVVGD